MPDYINPTSESFAAFRESVRTGPIQMLNLIKLKDQAAYEDGTTATGAEAYGTYGRLSGPIFAGYGGRIIWSGRPEVMVIGPQNGEEWDIAFIAEYPDMEAFMKMIGDPAYRAVTHHRTAAVANSRLLRCEASTPGTGFAG